MKIRLPNLRNDLMPHFIRGYFDGDGCFSTSIGRKSTGNLRGVFKIVSNRDFCEDVALFLKGQLGIYLGVYSPSPNKEVGAVQCGNDVTMSKLYDYMYSNHTVCLERKRIKFRVYLDSKI